MLTVDIKKSISKNGNFNFFYSGIYISKSLQSYGDKKKLNYRFYSQF